MDKSLDLQNAFKIIKIWQQSKGLQKFDSDPIRSIRKYIRRNTNIDKYFCRRAKNEFIVGTLDDYNRYTYDPHRYWLDDFMEFIKSNGTTLLHNKAYYIRNNNKFYDSSKYFLFENNVYSRVDYALEDGELIDKTKTLELNEEYDYPDSNDRNQRVDMHFRIILPEDQHFESAEETEKRYEESRTGKTPVIISGPNSHLSSRFWLSMLRCGNKRFRANGTLISLSAEEAEKIVFDPLPVHKEILQKYIQKVKETHTYCNVSSYATDPDSVEKYNARAWNYFQICFNYFYLNKARKSKDMCSKIKVLLNQVGENNTMSWDMCKKWIKMYTDMEKVVRKYA